MICYNIIKVEGVKKMNSCSNCGNKINPNATHCGFYGKYLGNDNININNKNDLNGRSNNVIDNYYNDKSYIRMSESKKYARISLILALIPVMLIAFCYIKSLGSFDESEAGAIWWLVILYFMTAGIPIAIASIILGIVSFLYKKNTLAIISVFIVLFPLIFSLLLSLS